MKITDRQKLATDIFNECLDVLLKKGKDYSGEDDCLSNFKRIAKLLDLTKHQIWAAYFTKQTDSVINSIKRSPNKPQVESEPIRSRVVDIINYAIIFYALNEEDKLPNEPPNELPDKLTNEPKSKELLSQCCSRGVIIDYTDKGTCYYVCQNCGVACDVK